MSADRQEGEVRHILSVSGGKDSSALAVYMRDRIPKLEYVFCDTDKELPETEEFIGKLQAYLGKPIHKLSRGGRTFDHYLGIYRGYLPSARMRWCTRHLKIEPFEEFVGTGRVIHYIGIRADEDREGMISTKPNIMPNYPFIDEGITKADVMHILDLAGLGMPDYYRWRTRSGCYFCFFQQKHEWLGLYRYHPELFRAACKYEKFDEETGRRFTWCDNESLTELVQPARMEQVREEHRARIARCPEFDPRLLARLPENERACLVCEL